MVPFFRKMKDTGTIPITDPRMTRFWITLEKGVEFVLQCLDKSEGGELYVPKIPSMNIMDLAEALAPDCKYETVGIRPGEKIHEVMITEDDARHTLEYEDHFVIEPEFVWWSDVEHIKNGGKRVKEGFRYASDINDHWLTVDDLRELSKDT